MTMSMFVSSSRPWYCCHDCNTSRQSLSLCRTNRR